MAGMKKLAMTTGIGMSARARALPSSIFGQAMHPELPVVVISGTQDESMAREVLNDGAWDYVPKPVDLGYLARVIAAATAGTVEQPQADRRAS